jgi:hypothetical protein
MVMPRRCDFCATLQQQRDQGNFGDLGKHREAHGPHIGPHSSVIGDGRIGPYQPGAFFAMIAS